MSALALAATVPVRLEFACGHAALVTLPRIKGESARQQNQRVSQEKVVARARPCDFCGPRDDAVLHHATALGVAVARHTAADSTVGNGHQLHATSAREESTMHNVSLDPSPPTEEATIAETDTRPAGVFPPPRKLTAEQERELTHLYAETRTPIADIARTFSLSEVSVGRIAQRNGAPSRRRRGAARDTTPEAATVPTSGRRGRRRAGAETEAVEATGGPEQGRQRRADGTGPQGRGRRRRAPAADGAAAAHALPAAASGADIASETAGDGVRRRFRIRFFAETVVEAEDLREALGQAEALGATDIIGIVQEDS